MKSIHGTFFLHRNTSVAKSMNKSVKNILSRFLQNEDCTKEELDHLRQSMSDGYELEDIFNEEWNKEYRQETKVELCHIQARIREVEKSTLRGTRINKILMKYPTIAAVLVLPIILFSIYFISNQFSSETKYNKVIAEEGQKSKIELPDGTKVWLNSGSQIEYPNNFGKRDRAIHLLGEAYFEVAKDKKHPFIVQSGKIQIRVLGTVFNLKAYPEENEIETTLFEGKIELMTSPENKKVSKVIEMQPGQILSLDKEKNILRYKRFESEEVLAWTKNQLIFRDESFENMVREIERWYDIEIIYEEKDLSKQRLTVELYEGELINRLLDIIELTMNVECYVEDDKIYIKAKNKQN